MPNSTLSTCVLGEALAVLRAQPDHSFDHCVADPPYNMSKKKGLAWAFSRHVTMQESWDQFTQDGYFTFCMEWVQEVCRVVKPNGNLFFFGTFHNIYTLGFLLQHFDRKILNSIIWVKPNAQPNITCRMLTESSEQLVWACNNTRKSATGWCFDYPESKKFNGGKQLRNVWSFPLTRRSERVAKHPSQKPEALLERILLVATKPGDCILDPFAGVGTTGIAAVRNGRSCFLIEKDRRYWKAQRTRFDAAGLSRKVLFTTAADMVKSSPKRRNSRNNKALAAGPAAI